jgi:hypothetical protein
MSDFNRGLEQGIELGILKERERIIKLLDDHYNETLELFGVALARKKLDALLELRDLIKGEK